MSKKLLSPTEITDLVSVLSEVFDDITNKKQKTKIARYIQYPKLPPSLTESICVHLIKKKIILSELSDYTVSFGGILSDIMAINESETKKIEVKSTGKTAFQYVGPKDISADYLVWIHFDKAFLENNFDNILVITVKNPSQFLKNPQKITLDKLRKLVNGQSYEKYFSIHSLQ